MPSKIKTIGLLFENFENLTLNGNGALFIIHGKMTNFAFVKCNTVTMQNMSFDFERPTMSELSLETVTDSAVVATVNPSSKFTVLDEKLKFYGDNWTMENFHTIAVDTTLSAWYYSSIDKLLHSKVSVLAPNKVKFLGDFSVASYKPGQVLTVRDPIRDQVGVFIGYSKNVTIKNVNMHYMHGMGIIGQFSENITLDGVTVKPRKITGRKIAAFADCFHFSGCKGQITIKNCITHGAHDDAVNIHGTYLKAVKKVAPNKINVKFMHHQTYGFDALFNGDTLALIKPESLQAYGYIKVKTVANLTERIVQITTEKDLPSNFNVDDVVENITWTPTVNITDNYFSGTNTRGVLLTTPKKSVIQNNVFYRTGMHAILISNDASSWYESGAVKDVLIKDNKFVDCAYNNAPNNYVINIWPENHKRKPKHYVHQNIVVEGNTFKVFDTPILKAKDTRKIIFTDNKIESTNTFPQFKSGKPAFLFEACTEVELMLNVNETKTFDAVETRFMKPRDIKIKAK